MGREGVFSLTPRPAKCASPFALAADWCFHIHRHTILPKPDGLPKAAPRVIPDEHIDADARDSLPGVLPEPLKEASADSAAPALTAHEDLPQIDVFCLASKQRIADDCTAILDDRGFMVRSQPVRHALHELGNRH